MPFIYVNLNEQKSLEREPYTSFTKKYEVIKENLNGEKIELRVGNGKSNSFSNGFFTDDGCYAKNLRLNFIFASLPKDDTESTNGKTLIRMTYSFEYDDAESLNYHLDKVKALEKRVPFFYIPLASAFEMTYQINSEFTLLFDVVVDDEKDVQQVCYSLINQIITIYSFEN